MSAIIRLMECSVRELPRSQFRQTPVELDRYSAKNQLSFLVGIVYGTVVGQKL